MFLKYITPNGDQITQSLTYIVNVSAIKLNGSTLPNKFFVDAIDNRKYEVTEDSYLMNLPYILFTDKYKINSALERVKNLFSERARVESSTNEIKSAILDLENEKYQTVWNLNKLSQKWLFGLFEISNEVEIKDDNSDVAKKIIEDTMLIKRATHSDVIKMKNELNRLVVAMKKDFNIRHTNILNM